MSAACQSLGAHILSSEDFHLALSRGQAVGCGALVRQLAKEN
ncbi:MAG: hypothetical protein ACYDAI_16370 [Trichloromonadaceae bacterium]